METCPEKRKKVYLILVTNRAWQIVNIYTVGLNYIFAIVTAVVVVIHVGSIIGSIGIFVKIISMKVYNIIFV